MPVPVSVPTCPRYVNCARLNARAHRAGNSCQVQTGHSASFRCHAFSSAACHTVKTQQCKFVAVCAYYMSLLAAVNSMRHQPSGDQCQLNWHAAMPGAARPARPTAVTYYIRSLPMGRHRPATKCHTPHKPIARQCQCQAQQAKPPPHTGIPTSTGLHTVLRSTAQPRAGIPYHPDVAHPPYVQDKELTWARPELYSINTTWPARSRVDMYMYAPAALSLTDKPAVTTSSTLTQPQQQPSSALAARLPADGVTQGLAITHV